MKNHNLRIKRLIQFIVGGERAPAAFRRSNTNTRLKTHVPGGGIEPPAAQSTLPPLDEERSPAKSPGKRPGEPIPIEEKQR